MTMPLTLGEPLGPGPSESGGGGGSVSPITLTLVEGGAGFNGDTISAGAHDATTALGFTGHPDTFAGGGDTGTADPQVEFQASYDGGVTWADILGCVEGVTAGVALVAPVDDLATVYDMGAPFNVPLQYRARNVAVSDGQTYVSAWSTVVNL